MIFCLLGSYMVSSAGFLSFFIRIPPIPILSFGVYLFLFSCLYLAFHEVFPVALALFINYLFIVSTPPPSLNFFFFLCLIFFIILCLFWWPFVICLVGVVFFLFILWIHSSTIVTHDYSFHISWWCCNLPLQYTIIVILKIWITGYCSGLCHRNGIGCISCNVLLIFFSILSIFVSWSSFTVTGPRSWYPGPNFCFWILSGLCYSLPIFLSHYHVNTISFAFLPWLLGPDMRYHRTSFLHEGAMSYITVQ